MDRHRSLYRKVHNLFAPMCRLEVMPHEKKQMQRRQSKLRVLKVNEQRIDESSLAVILDRRAQKLYVSEQCQRRRERECGPHCAAGEQLEAP